MKKHDPRQARLGLLEVDELTVVTGRLVTDEEREAARREWPPERLRAECRRQIAAYHAAGFEVPKALRWAEEEPECPTS